MCMLPYGAWKLDKLCYHNKQNQFEGCCNQLGWFLVDIFRAVGTSGTGGARGSYVVSTVFDRHGSKNFFIKGQLISKCPFGVFKSPKKNNENFVRISVLASKKRSKQNGEMKSSNQRYKVPLFFYLTSFKRLGQKSLK